MEETLINTESIAQPSDAMLIDSIQMDMSNSSLVILNIAVGLIMFGVALDLKIEDFTRILKSPKGPIIGLCSQFFLLPALTFLLILGLEALYNVFPFPGFRPHPSIALGLILISACPGMETFQIFYLISPKGMLHYL